jgi:histidyl-tRNA synthetase
MDTCPWCGRPKEPNVVEVGMVVHPSLSGEGSELAMQVRRQGVSVLTNCGFSMRRQMKEVARRDPDIVLIIAPDEYAEGQMIERCLTTGQEVRRPLSDLSEFVPCRDLTAIKCGDCQECFVPRNQPPRR